MVAHGGQSSSTEPTDGRQPAVLRMIPIAAAIRHALRGSGTVVMRPRFELRGWNGDQASPVDDLNQALDGIAAAYGPVPVVLIGHSMGARAAMRAAGHPSVYAVAGLAPWLPLGEPVEQLAGRRVLVAHGTADAVTNPQETWAYVERARAVTQVSRHRGTGRRSPDAAPRAPVARHRGRIRPRRPRAASRVRRRRGRIRGRRGRDDGLGTPPHHRVSELLSVVRWRQRAGPALA